MSSSKILQRMWSEMKVDFEEMMSTVATQNTLPKRSVLEEYQASVQDLIDIFDTAEDMSGSAKPPASSTKSDVSETSKQARKPDHITAEEEEFIWSAYLKNYKQYLSGVQARVVGKVIHRRAPNVLNSLRKLIAADRNVPLDNALDNAFSAHDDTRIWNYYLTNVADSYNSEGEIISSLSGELNRSSEEVQNRLRWLKHNEKRKQASWSQNKHYTPDEDKFVQDETLTVADVAQITGRSTRAIRERRRDKFNMGVGSELKHTKKRRGAQPSDPTFCSPPDAPQVHDTQETSTALWFEDGRFSSRRTQSQDTSVHTTSTNTASTSSDDSPHVGQKRSADGTGPIAPAKRCRDDSAQVVDLCANEEANAQKVPAHARESHPKSGWSYRRASIATPPHATPLVPTAHLTTPHHGRSASFPSQAPYKPPPARQLQQSMPTPAPAPMRSRVEEQGNFVEKFLVKLTKDGMTVLVPLLAHDQVLALILGHMLHCGAITPLYDDVVRSVRHLMASAEELQTTLPDISTSKIAQIITLLVRAHCLQIPYIPEYANTNVQHLRLSTGIGSFSSLRQRHDAYLTRVMGPDASRLEILLWPSEFRKQQTLDDKMHKLMRAVWKLLSDK